MTEDVGIKASDIWAVESFVAKFQKYMEQASQYEKKDWRYGLWTSLALESLLRGSLSNISPVLLADASDWNNLVFGIGKSPIAKKFNPKSVATSDVITRLEALYPTFGSDHATIARAITGKRNAELHTAEAAFDGENVSGWVARFFKVVFALLETLALSPSNVLDGKEVQYAQNIIDAEEDEAAKSVKKTINGHKTVWEGKPTSEQDELRSQSLAWASQTSGHRVLCPACDCQGLVTGDPISPPVISVQEDEVIEKQKYLPARFECIACQLKISGFSKLAVAGLADEFTRTDRHDKFDYFVSAMDEYVDYEPDFNC